jgi:hypothetical protein
VINSMNEPPKSFRAFRGSKIELATQASTQVFFRVLSHISRSEIEVAIQEKIRSIRKIPGSLSFAV